MNIGTFSKKDLDRIGDLQPQDWPDIRPHYEYYVNSPFCFPVKVEIDGRIVGIGTSIRFDHTAWIAHIIVDSQFRNKGIGNQIVSELVTDLQKEGLETCSLIATELGYSVYKKIGFRVVSEYSFLSRKTPNTLPAATPYTVPSTASFMAPSAGTDNSARTDNPADIDSNPIFPFKDEYRPAIYVMDRQVSGENRERLLVGYLDDSLVYLDANKVRGYYMPRLNEGLIIADTEEAGTALMKIKYATTDRAILPSDNHAGMSFLLQNGFKITERKGIRMVLGIDIHWQPTSIYGRIGGNLG